MTPVQVRENIQHLVSAIVPFDELEQDHVDFVLKWIQSDVDIFRAEEPATPNPHLVSYFLVLSTDRSKVLLVHHKKSGLWLPSGGHVELNEEPKITVIREAQEELGMQAEFLCENPHFVTVTQTVGHTPHTDVSLWYILQWNPDEPLNFDSREFHQIRWFQFDDIPFSQSDPHLKRFLLKLKKQNILN